MKYILFFIILLAVSCSGSKTKQPGDIVMIKKQCLAADTKENYKLMTDISIRKDEPALIQMMNNGHVAVISTNTTGTIRDVAFGMYLLEFEGALQKQRMWVATEYIE